MTELRALIPAAGTGSRAGLPYPKTLHPVEGVPILLRQLDLLRLFDPCPVVVASPAGRVPIAETLGAAGARAELVEQASPTGMGDAILCLDASIAGRNAEHVVAVWGDIPLLDPRTIAGTVERHLAAGNDFTFPTRHVEAAYTVVTRDAAGRVTALAETREAGVEPGPGERDIGVFVFRRAPVFDLLRRRLPGALGTTTGEHGFLYIVRHLAEHGHRVEALPIATERDLISLNRLSDLDGVGGV
ncbi:MAG TPA: NTP transferase domain-containing protein [Sphingomonas sp.]|jgi:bifunctional UDP-N-acetylglucosamine pyrophosphorylase/glucosamine-1-phosphate N-acetyltransferase